ncbi:hypothetical protein BRADI_3g06310v3 [Brachypodium distachyon]|uniref:Uncharacterized protein n=1 Tax=Brachypodium distachyon TaxID=15368 RepID=I1HY25_BRADI|nr:hypothetical protein BRADI_3g06310v3 [Brachypodium distachyon]
MESAGSHNAYIYLSFVSPGYDQRNCTEGSKMDAPSAAATSCARSEASPGRPASQGGGSGKPPVSTATTRTVPDTRPTSSPYQANIRTYSSGYDQKEPMSQKPAPPFVKADIANTEMLLVDLVEADAPWAANKPTCRHHHTYDAHALSTSAMHGIDENMAFQNNQVATVQDDANGDYINFSLDEDAIYTNMRLGLHRLLAQQ